MFTNLDELAHYENAITTAADPGYVLVGAGEKVYRRDPDHGPHAVTPVPAAEAETVLRLLDARKLLTSATGRRPAEVDGEPVHGREVHPRRRSLDLVRRNQRDRATHTRTGRTCSACAGAGSHPRVELATWTPERGMHRPPAGTIPCASCQTPTPLTRTDRQQTSGRTRR